MEKKAAIVWFNEHQRQEAENKWLQEQSAKPVFRKAADYIAAFCHGTDRHGQDNAHWSASVIKADTQLEGTNLFIPADGIFPGGYVHAYLRIWKGNVTVVVYDGDDFYYGKQVEDVAAGIAELENLEKLAPFHQCQLKMFGYGPD
jgi:hypothetical protein